MARKLVTYGYKMTGLAETARLTKGLVRGMWVDVVYDRKEERMYPVRRSKWESDARSAQSSFDLVAEQLAPEDAARLLADDPVLFALEHSCTQQDIADMVYNIERGRYYRR